VTSTMVSAMQGVRWCVRPDEYAGDFSDVISTVHSVSETDIRYAIQCDKYDVGGYVGSTEIDDT